MADLLNTNPNDSYGDDAIVTLSPREHIRLRPGMYIGKLGDGTQADDGIYVLIKGWWTTLSMSSSWAPASRST